MKKLNWPNLIAEFVVVLVGILLAFQLNTCADETKQKETIQIHLSALKEETFKRQSTYLMKMKENLIRS